MKKKLLALMLGTALTASVVSGCGSSTESASTETTSEAAGTTAEAATEEIAEETTGTEGETAKPMEGEHLVFGINATFAPFEYVEGSDENGEEILAGLDVDFIEKLSEMLGFTYEFSDMEFSGLIGAISSGRCDVIVSGISINEEREEVVDATKPYFIPRIAILSYADNEYKDIASLEGKSVGVSFGTVYDTICTDNGNIDVKALDSTAIAFQELTNKTVDACMFDANQAQTFIDDNADMNLVRNILPDEIAEEYEINGYCVLVPEGETERLGYFNDAIDELQANGWMDELIIKWCGEDYLD